MRKWLPLMLLAGTAWSQDAADGEALADAIGQLRHAAGDWVVTTEFLDAAGETTRTVPGVYRFRWVVVDRVLSGESELEGLGSTALLFYVNEGEEKIEMVSVNSSGRLWIMSGPLGGETRYTQEYRTADGNTARLRFTRYNVEPDRFESRMEYTTDGGASWLPGNRQVFERVPAAGGAS